MAFYNSLLGSSNNFNSIWCDATTSINNGVMYVATADGLMFVDLNTDIVVNYFTNTIKGSTNEVLTDTNIVDLNVVVST